MHHSSAIKPSNVPGNVACPWCMPWKPQRLRDHQRFRLHNGSLTHQMFSLRHEVGLGFAIPILHRVQFAATTIEKPCSIHYYVRGFSVFTTPTNLLTIDFCTLCVRSCFPRGGFNVEPPIADSTPFPSAFFPSLLAAIFGNAGATLFFWEGKSFPHVPFFSVSWIRVPRCAWLWEQPVPSWNRNWIME